MTTPTTYAMIHRKKRREMEEEPRVTMKELMDVMELAHNKSQYTDLFCVAKKEITRRIKGDPRVRIEVSR